MEEKKTTLVTKALILLLFINLLFPVIYFLWKPAPIQAAAATATYSETWEAEYVSITNVDVYRSGCRNWIADSKYISIPKSSISSYWSGRAYEYPWNWWGCRYNWNVSPHGFVTQWKVTGRLVQN